VTDDQRCRHCNQTLRRNGERLVGYADAVWCPERLTLWRWLLRRELPHEEARRAGGHL
jgi:hypothetical protein